MTQQDKCNCLGDCQAYPALDRAVLVMERQQESRRELDEFRRTVLRENDELQAAVNRERHGKHLFMVTAIVFIIYSFAMALKQAGAL